MDAGFAKAIELFPELHEQINDYSGAMGACIALCDAVRKCYAGPFPHPDSPVPNDELIERAYAYADWCLAAPRGSDAGNDPYTGVIIGFFESLSWSPAAMSDLPRWLRYSQVAALRGIFEYFSSEEEIDALLIHVAKNAAMYRQRPRIESDMISADGEWRWSPRKSQ